MSNQRKMLRLLIERLEVIRVSPDLPVGVQGACGDAAHVLNGFHKDLVEDDAKTTAEQPWFKRCENLTEDNFFLQTKLARAEALNNKTYYVCRGCGGLLVRRKGTVSPCDRCSSMNHKEVSLTAEWAKHDAEIKDLLENLSKSRETEARQRQPDPDKCTGCGNILLYSARWYGDSLCHPCAHAELAALKGLSDPKQEAEPQEIMEQQSKQPSLGWNVVTWDDGAQVRWVFEQGGIRCVSRLTGDSVSCSSYPPEAEWQPCNDPVQVISKNGLLQRTITTLRERLDRTPE